MRCWWEMHEGSESPAARLWWPLSPFCSSPFSPLSKLPCVRYKAKETATRVKRSPGRQRGRGCMGHHSVSEYTSPLVSRFTLTPVTGLLTFVFSFFSFAV